MVALLRSIALFLWGILKRFYLWLPAILLDPFDLYNKYIKLRLPPEWQEDIEMPSEAFPYVLAGGLIWASVMTYHELRTSRGRDPKIPEKLKDFYVRSEPYSRFDLKNESEFADWKVDANKWHKETYEWIVGNLSPAAASRFLDTPASTMGGMRVKNSAAVNDEHDQLVHVVKRERDHLIDLIENEAWDTKGRRKEKWRLANIFRSKKRAVREK